MQSVNRFQTHLSSILLTALAAICFAGSGSADAASNSIPVAGALSVHFEASDGTQGSPENLNLVMVNPPLGLEKLELRGDLSALYFSADCNGKRVRIHDQESLIDTDWAAAESGTFEFNFTSPSIEVTHDGEGHQNCMADVNLHIRGKLDCHNINAPGIDAEIAYQFASDGGSRGHSTSCSFPRDAYLYGRL